MPITQACVVRDIVNFDKTLLHCGKPAAVPKRSYIMKMFSVVLITLALLSMAAPANAFDARSFYAQSERASY
jgi:hypothetical protein